MAVENPFDQSNRDTADDATADASTSIAVPTTISDEFGAITPLPKLGIALAACSAAAAGIGFASYMGHLDLGFYAVMLATLLFGVMKAILAAQRLQMWSEASAAEVDYLEREPDLHEFLDATRESPTPFRRLVFSLVVSRRKGQTLDAADRLRVLENVLQRPAATLRLLSSLLVLGGVTGTASAAMLVLHDLSSFASESDLTGGMELFGRLLGVGGPIAGLAPAYGTTVLGLAGAICLAALAGVLDREADQYASHCRELVVTYVVPDLNPITRSRSNAKK